MTPSEGSSPPKAPPRFPFCERNRVRALLFDWDGVVVDSGADYFRAYELALEPERIQPSPREVFLQEGRRTAEVIAELFAVRGIPLSDAKLEELVMRRKGFYERTARHLFFSGIWDLLRELRAAGYTLGLVTGSSRVTDVLPLTPEREAHFDAVVTADDIHNPKPDPEPYRISIERLGVPAAQCLAIENAPCGIESAHRAGCRVVAICTTLEANDLRSADWIVPDHAALRALLSN